MKVKISVTGKLNEVFLEKVKTLTAHNFDKIDVQDIFENVLESYVKYLINNPEEFLNAYELAILCFGYPSSNVNDEEVEATYRRVASTVFGIPEKEICASPIQYVKDTLYKVLFELRGSVPDQCSECGGSLIRTVYCKYCAIPWDNFNVKYDPVGVCSECGLPEPVVVYTCENCGGDYVDEIGRVI